MNKFVDYGAQDNYRDAAKKAFDGSDPDALCKAIELLHKEIGGFGTGFGVQSLALMLLALADRVRELEKRLGDTAST